MGIMIYKIIYQML